MNQFVPQCYVPNGGEGPLGLRHGQRRFGIGSFSDCWWLARQDDGSVAQIGFGDINVPDMERIAHVLEPGEVWVICLKQDNHLMRRQHPALLDALTRGEGVMTIEHIVEYATFILGHGRGVVTRTSGINDIVSGVFLKIERDAIRELLNRFEII